ncbi:hypothetical protein AgCh_001050 [Apium graveolens]
MIVGLWCAHPDYQLRPTIRQAIQVLNFEAPLPSLASTMPKLNHLTVPPSTCFNSHTGSSGVAIETNSNYHMRKMVNYWILFSLICLFEHTFSGLLQWLPVWSYAKLLAIFWLVIPCFDGAIIAYDTLVSPCISAQLLQVVLDLLNKNQNLSIEGEPFLALEKLISLKPKNIEPTFAEADIKQVESLIESAPAPENKTTAKLNANVEVNNMTLPSPLEDNVQREWTCAVCLVTTTSKATLNSHLLGRKHRTRCEELKAGKQTTEKVVTVGGPNRARYCTICQVKAQSEATWNSHVQSKKHKSKCMELKAIVKEAKNNNFLSTATKSYQANEASKKASSHGGPNNKITSANTDPKRTSSDGGVNYRFGCDICEVTVQSEVTLKSHLQGRKQKSKSEELKAREMTEKDVNESLKAITTSSAPSTDEKNGGLNNSEVQKINKLHENQYNSNKLQQQDGPLPISYLSILARNLSV